MSEFERFLGLALENRSTMTSTLSVKTKTLLTAGGLSRFEIQRRLRLFHDWVVEFDAVAEWVSRLEEAGATSMGPNGVRVRSWERVAALKKELEDGRATRAE